MIVQVDFVNYICDRYSQMIPFRLIVPELTYPQPREERTELNLMTRRWVTPTRRFLWAHLNNTPIWIPLEDAIN